jgi:hypothetical protein
VGLSRTPTAALAAAQNRSNRIVDDRAACAVVRSRSEVMPIRPRHDAPAIRYRFF